MEIWWIFPLASAFLLSAWLTPLARIFALRFGAVDAPNVERKRQPEAVPLFGGLGMIAAFVLVSGAVLFGTNAFTSGTISFVHFVGFFLGVGILTTVGIVDDRRNLPAFWLLCAMVLASLVATAGGINVAKLTNPSGGFFTLAPWIGSLIAFVWILSMTMTTKLLDGVDGLASSVGGVAAVMIASLALTEKYFQPDVALLAGVFAASILGFVLWNWYPARVYLGESGSTVIGFTIGVLSVISGSKMATALLVLGLPLIDVGLVAIRRVFAGKNPFTSPDRRHAHLMLQDLGLPAWAVTCVYIVISVAFGVTALVFERKEKLAILMLLTVSSGVGILILARFLAKKSRNMLDGSQKSW